MVYADLHLIQHAFNIFYTFNNVERPNSDLFKVLNAGWTECWNRLNGP